MTCDAVLVHYGPTEPTIEVAMAAAAWAERVIVVANDKSPKPAGLPDEVIWVIPERNLGFGAAFNLGADFGRAEIVAVLNNDIELPSEAVAACVNEFQKSAEVVIAGPVLMYPDGSVQSSAGTFSKWIRWPIARTGVPERATDCEWLTGAVMLVRRSYWDSCPMDETYFLGCEDADYCSRARHSGFRVLIVPAVGAIHYGSQVISGPRWNYYYARNHLWFSRKHFSPTRQLLLFFWLIARTVRVAIADQVKHRGFQRSKSMWLGVRDGLRPKPPFGSGPLEEEPIPAKWLDW